MNIGDGKWLCEQLSFAYNSRLDISEKSGHSDNRTEMLIHDVVTGGKYGNFI